jgi:hypothetical protein
MYFFQAKNILRCSEQHCVRMIPKSSKQRINTSTWMEVIRNKKKSQTYTQTNDSRVGKEFNNKIRFIERNRLFLFRRGTIQNFMYLINTCTRLISRNIFVSCFCEANFAISHINFLFVNYSITLNHWNAPHLLISNVSIQTLIIAWI